MLQPKKQEITWRNNWFIVNWVMAILLLRSLFKPTLLEAVDSFLDDAAMLSMGILFMLLNVLDMEMDDDLGIKVGKSLATMVMGMTTGMAAYNTLKSGSVYTYQRFFKKEEEVADDKVPLATMGDGKEYFTA